MLNLKVIRFIFVFFLTTTFVQASSNGVEIKNLTVEYTISPIGIDVEKPRFGWQMLSPGNERGVYQTAYQITVSDLKGEIFWDSYKVNGSNALAISYKGLPLKPVTRYEWKVRVWDNKNNEYIADSWFETGLMNPSQSAWDGAEWIGGSDNDLVFFSHYLSIFRMRYSLKIAEGSSRASMIYGANDIRLLDKFKNVFQIENKRNESYVKLELDISGLNGNADGLAKINIYRAGYSKDDNPAIPVKSFTVKPEIINLKNKNEAHTIDFYSVFGQITLSLDGQDDFHLTREGEKDNKIPASMRRPGSAFVNINPLGTGGDYIPFGMVCEIGFALDAGQSASFSGVEIFNDRPPCNSLFKENLSGNYNGIFAGKITVVDGAYQLKGGANGVFIVADPSRNSTPMLRTEFSTGKKIESARLYVTSRGIYEVFINGKKVGKDHYNPGQTQYNKSHFYQTYDVTDMIKNGQNAIGAMMAEGWWSGLLSFGSNWNHFGDRQSLLAKLVIICRDGTKSVITTNNKKWKYFNYGPIIYSSLDMGEVYDANREKTIKGWSEPGFDDKHWKNASIIPLQGTTISGKRREFDNTFPDYSFEDVKLLGQIGNSASEFKILTAKSVKEVRKGVYVYDMGQNFVGVPKISIDNGVAGDTIILRFSEMLYPDFPESRGNVGMIMTENYRSALCQDIYIMKSGKQVFQPKFTSRGYRYIEITGIDAPISLNAVQGIAISSVLNLTAHYKTSNPKVNQLWSNLVWSNIGNFLTLPTDCPQRNERVGWSGDISVFARTATYISNSNQFLRRHLFAMRDVQNENGRFSDVSPMGGGFGGLLWGIAGITVPWEVYQQYKDTFLLAEHYEAMVKYIDYLETTLDPETHVTKDGQLGDWLGPQNQQLGTPFLTTAYHVYGLYIMKNVAEILGKKDDAIRFDRMYIKRKGFFNRTFVSDEKKTLGGIGRTNNNSSTDELKTADTQTSYAVGLALGVFNDELIPIMATNLAKTVQRKSPDDGGIVRPEYSLMTGFIGTAWISKALSDNGYDDIAYKLLQNNQYPSWLYSIEQGATTIWERLNGYTVENGFGGYNSMNSFNHYSFGAVGQWMIAYSLGIQRDEPGFQKFILRPTPDPTAKMTWAEGYYDSMYGRIYSKWKIKDGNVTYEMTIPANTSATLYLPVNSETDILSSDGCKLDRLEKGQGVYQLQSGNYRFITKSP